MDGHQRTWVKPRATAACTTYHSQRVLNADISYADLSGAQYAKATPGKSAVSPESCQG